MYILLLTIHLAGAIVMGLTGVISVLAVVLQKSQWYKKLAYIVAGLGGLQIVSGLTLSFFSSTSLLVVCSKLLVYLGITIVLELVLIRKMAESVIQAPALSPNQPKIQ